MISVCVPCSALVHSIFGLKKKLQASSSTINFIYTSGARLLDDQCPEKRVLLLLHCVAVDVLAMT